MLWKWSDAYVILDGVDSSEATDCLLMAMKYSSSSAPGSVPSDLARLYLGFSGP